MNTTPIMSPIHPGEVLLQEYLEPLGITQHRLALAISVPPRRINEIVHGKRRISADTALRLARYFGTTERFWLNLQSRYDLEAERDRLAPTLARLQPLVSAWSRAVHRAGERTVQLAAGLVHGLGGVTGAHQSCAGIVSLPCLR
ncbi:MAG: HigA family addiction module antitoxin [Pseudonocardiaceae bacterium]